MEAKDLIPWGISVIMAVIAFAGWNRNSKTDTKSDAHWQGSVDEQLRQINTKLDPITKMPGEMEQVKYRLGKLEEKVDDHIRCDK